MQILVQTKSDVKATGLPMGAMIDYNDAPEYMQKRHDKLVNSTVSPELEEQIGRAHITALKIRQSIAGNHRIKTYSAKDETVANLIYAANFNGIKCLTA